jgi:hypothetical protein
LKEGVLLLGIRLNHLFITDALTHSETPAGGAQRWGKIVVQIHSHPGVNITSRASVAKLIAINAAAKRWPGIIRLRDSEKLILECCDWDVNVLREPFYEDPLGRAWIIDPGQEIPPKAL